MAECKNCFHQKVCKYKTEKISAGTTVQETIHECVDYTPTADVVEARHEEWVDIHTTLMCSECGIIRAKGTTGVYNYCPNCGAKMDLK